MWQVLAGTSPAGWQHVSQSIMVEPEAARFSSYLVFLLYLLWNVELCLLHTSFTCFQCTGRTTCACAYSYTISYGRLLSKIIPSIYLIVMHTQFVFVTHPSQLDVWMRLIDLFCKDATI